MTFDGDTTQHQIDLVVTVPEPSEVLDDPQTGLTVGHGGVHVVLFAVFVDAEPFKVDHPTWAELRLHGPGDVNWGLASDHAEFLLAVLDDLELDGDFAGDFDGATKGDFSVSL